MRGFVVVVSFITITFVLMCFGAQKKRLIETVVLSTNNISFGWEIRKINFSYALLSGSLIFSSESSSKYHKRLWRVCTYAQTRLSLCCSMMPSDDALSTKCLCAGSKRSNKKTFFCIVFLGKIRSFFFFLFSSQ